MKLFLTVLIVLASAASLMAASATAKTTEAPADKYAVKVPGGLGFAGFRGAEALERRSARIHSQ